MKSQHLHAPWRTAARLTLVLALTGGLACRRADTSAPDLRAELTLLPTPPLVGESAVTLHLTDAGGAPLAGATVRLEGNMNHAGMKPSFADLKEEAPGRYAGTLNFTMGGDWFVIVTATLSDGRRVERKIDVPGVRVR